MHKKIIQDLNKLKNSKHAKALQWFFKTGPGEYGEGDIFLGLRMAQNRAVAKKYFKDTTLIDIQKLLNSKIHEHRMVAVLMLVEKYKQAGLLRSVLRNKLRNKIFNFYLKNAKRINNWDLVDLSASRIVGAYLLNRKRDILYKLVKSKNLWERRISIISTGTFIYNNQFEDTIKICGILLNDKHDLIHKACGWMLREMGKRDEKELVKFLDKYTIQMPRTMLRYSIEKFPEKKRKYYLNK